MGEDPATADWPEPAGAAPADCAPVPGYEVLGELGRGGMGVVFKARQVQHDRLVALKMLHGGALAGPRERARFRLEAEAAARTQHPNIVDIYEVGEHAGRPYFVMEYVAGGSLDQYLAGRPLPASQAAELVRTLALAVQHAHEQRIIHRDLKPANVLLAACGLAGDTAKPQAAEFVPKITDFGLAKRLDSESTAWTQDGAVMGSANYMAPEQAAGRVQEFGPATDVWALGAILYECLTGRPPFRGDSRDQTVSRVLHEEPEPPARLQPDVPRDLETVCLKCLEKEPGRRYASASELADDLGRFLDGKVVAAVPLGAQERLARLAGRDGYRVLGEVGRGPRSTVYRAEYGPLKQAVALKVFAEGVCVREEWEGRLRDGAALWATLAHPHIVPVQRAGWWDGCAYVAMEYVPQGNLAARLGGRPYPLRQALRLVEQLAEVIAYLHRQGVVHGNLKPSNVLLAADGIPRVADLRPTGGLFQGTPPAGDGEPAGLAYLPPEVVRDPGAEPRFHTDTYGLGLILYEVLTGRPAFGAAGAREVLEQVRSLDPVPPSRLNAEVTPPLETVCLWCLQKNPWKRYARAYDLATRLRHTLSETAERPPGRRQRPRT